MVYIFTFNILNHEEGQWYEMRRLRGGGGKRMSWMELSIFYSLTRDRTYDIRQSMGTVFLNVSAILWAYPDWRMRGNPNPFLLDEQMTVKMKCL